MDEDEFLEAGAQVQFWHPEQVQDKIIIILRFMYLTVYTRKLIFVECRYIYFVYFLKLMYLVTFKVN